MENVLLVLILLNAILLIIVVLVQPAQKTGLIGDATDSEKRIRRGFDLFTYRSTIFLIFTFFFMSIIYGMIQAGTFNLM